ncbi:hypothetical protein N657DRAFT_603548 [Parathielavia appendiculata]|uniref:AT hook domain-containing protein n=1 Tax=Parathielavia appendiculata TaxID=2587402 RepID=A0AAN6TSR3_9PEZI|nr:hypothetical protein N657DRAFT_603548 [Parathielavia appendiculata]
MASRREILDSEDDGSDFGDGPLSGNEDEMRRNDFDAAHETVIDASHSAGMGSTDPSFFQRVYDQQQAAVDEHHVIPDTAPVVPAASAWTELSSAPPPGQKPQAKEYSSLTSITDPMPASRRSKQSSDVAQAEVVDLTDLTTPSKEPASGTSDVWDVPTSTWSQRTTRTYGKRKMAQLSLEYRAPPENMPDTQDPYALPQSSPPARKKRNKRGTPSSSVQQPPDSSPVMLVHVPPEEPPSLDRRTRSSRKKKAGFGVGISTTESSMPDTAPPSLYVAQSTLTSSQNREYAVVGSSAEALPEVSETFLPGQSSMWRGELYKSSAATTIAYPTPSRIGSSRRLADVFEEMDGVDVAETSLSYDVGYQQSSPDVLTDMAAGNTATATRSRRKIASSGGLGSSELEPTPSARRTKRRKVVQEVDSEPRELDPLEGSREDTDAPQHTMHIAGELGEEDHPAAGDGIQAPLPDTEPTPTEVDPTKVPVDTQKPAANKGKRGRKKKGAKTQGPTLDVDEPAAAEATPQREQKLAGLQEPPTKRKRGRPRGSESAIPQAGPVEQEPEQQHTEEVQTEAEPNVAPQALSEASHNSQRDPAAGAKGDEGADKTNNNENGPPANDVDVSGKPKEKEKEKEKQAARDVKPSLQKVQYRVGLSKKSRIAPLLKSLKKPV